MTKEEIIKALKKISIPSKEIIILGEASLVMQDFLSQTNLITIASPKNIYEQLSWKSVLELLIQL